MRIDFRRLRSDDLPLLHRWLGEPHVRRWYAPEPATYAQVVDKYGPRTHDDHTVRSYMIVLDGRPVGYVQAYAADEIPDVGAGAVGVDLFIGEAAHVHRGVGAEVLRRFVGEVVFGRMGAGVCVADPHPENHASVRAFEKAGFRPWKLVRESGPEPALLLRRFRDADAPPGPPRSPSSS